MVKDQNGDILNGANDYCITFTPPKVSQFWSVTAYGSRTMLMIANDLNRHSRGDRHVKLNPDGTVTLRLSHDTTGKAEDTNWAINPLTVLTVSSTLMLSTVMNSSRVY
jgi:hypothetical protein